MIYYLSLCHDFVLHSGDKRATYTEFSLRLLLDHPHIVESMKNEVCETCSTHGEDAEIYLVVSPERKTSLMGLSKDRVTAFKYILHK
jgi:hypothetical protein